MKKNINKWLDAWKNKDLINYIVHYHSLYQDSFRQSLSEFKNYKKSVFQNPGNPRISIENISILSIADYTVVKFTQKYESKTLIDTGVKILYLKKDKNYNWKIISETWHKLKPRTTMAFTPSMRFFKPSTNDSDKI